MKTVFLSLFVATLSVSCLFLNFSEAQGELQSPLTVWDLQPYPLESMFPDQLPQDWWESLGHDFRQGLDSWSAPSRQQVFRLQLSANGSQLNVVTSTDGEKNRILESYKIRPEFETRLESLYNVLLVQQSGTTDIERERIYREVFDLLLNQRAKDEQSVDPNTLLYPRQGVLPSYFSCRQGIENCLFRTTAELVSTLRNLLMIKNQEGLHVDWQSCDYIPKFQHESESVANATGCLSRKFSMENFQVMGKVALNVLNLINETSEHSPSFFSDVDFSRPPK